MLAEVSEGSSSHYKVITDNKCPLYVFAFLCYWRNRVMKYERTQHWNMIWGLLLSVGTHTFFLKDSIHLWLTKVLFNFLPFQNSSVGVFDTHTESHLLTNDNEWQWPTITDNDWQWPTMTDESRKLPTMTNNDQQWPTMPKITDNDWQWQKWQNDKDDKYDKLTKTKKAKNTLTPNRKDNIYQCSPLYMWL